MAYTIKSGDTLSRIASENNTTVDELLKLNPQITDTNLIIIGKELNLPGDMPAQADQQAADNTNTTNPTTPNISNNPDDTVQPDAAVKADKAGNSIPGIMEGGTIFRVDNPSQEDYYVVGYEFPPGTGKQFYYRFDSLDSLEQAVGPGLGGGKVPVGGTIPESQLSGWVNGGNANEIVGVTGSFDAYINDIINEAASKAGLSDPTLVGAALSDPDIQLILAQTAEGKWSPQQTKAALRKTDYYKNTLYPGIENFYSRSDKPEQEYDTYLRNISNTAKSLGLPKGADGSYKEMVGNMLDAKVSDVAFASFAPIYKRAQANADYAAALNKWTEKYAGVTINSFSDWYDVLAGNAPAEVSQIAEVAGLQYMADNAGFGITDTELRTLADTVNLTEEQAGRVFSNTARSLLSLGERGLRRGGITAQDVLDAEAGFNVSGKDIEKIKLKVQKLATEEGLVDNPSAKYFTNYDSQGRPVKAGLRSSLKEGA